MQKVEIRTSAQPVTVHDDPVAYFLGKYKPATQPVLTAALRTFFRWLSKREGWTNVGPKELLIRQLQSENPYEIPELLQEYMKWNPNLRRSTKYHRLWVVLEYLRKNHAHLHRDVKACWFRIQSHVRPVEGRLTADIITKVIVGLPARWRSIFLVKYQAMLDETRLYWMNLNSTDQIATQLQRDREIVRVDIPCGRKKHAGDSLGVYFTYFGRDAASDLTRYFNEERG